MAKVDPRMMRQSPADRSGPQWKRHHVRSGKVSPRNPRLAGGQLSAGDAAADDRRRYLLGRPRVWCEGMRDKVWPVPPWPKEYGGGVLDPEEAKIVRQEMAALGARQPLVSFGISMLGPALLKYGTERA